MKARSACRFHRGDALVFSHPFIFPFAGRVRFLSLPELRDINNIFQGVLGSDLRNHIFIYTHTIYSYRHIYTEAIPAMYLYRGFSGTATPRNQTCNLCAPAHFPTLWPPHCALTVSLSQRIPVKDPFIAPSYIHLT